MNVRSIIFLMPTDEYDLIGERILRRLKIGSERKDLSVFWGHSHTYRTLPLLLALGEGRRRR